MACSWDWRAELSPDNFGLSHTEAELFRRSQWTWPPIVCLIYRVLTAVYMVTWLILSSTILYEDIHNFPPSVWLTHWSLVVLCCHLVLAAVTTLQHSRSYPSLFAWTRPIMYNNRVHDEHATGEAKIPWYIKIDWVFFNVGAAAAPIITTVYFAFLFPDVAARKNLTYPKAADFHVHAMNLIIVLFELAISAIPVRIFHFIYPTLYALIYGVFSLIYWAIDNNNVLYGKIVNWNKPEMAVGVALVIAFVVFPLSHIIVFILYKVRMFVFRKIYRGNAINILPVMQSGKTDKIAIDYQETSKL